ncbi:MAG: amino acid adenylation domain-containing protein [Cyclobacteriaceae bacterium]
MKRFIRKLREHNIDIDVVDDQLQLNFPEGFDPAQIIEEVRANKADLIVYLQKVKNTKGYQAIETCEHKSQYVLSSAQYRMYLINQLHKNSTAYNLDKMVRVKGQLDIDKLDRVFSELIQRHEILRTYFEKVNDEPVQKIRGSVDFRIEKYFGSHDSVGEIADRFVRPFDLSEAPLLRVGLIDLQNTDEYILMLDVHHIVSDGISQNIIIKEFSQLYQGYDLPELTLQYKDYSEWQKTDSQTEALGHQKNFWLDTFRAEYDPNVLPIDYPRPRNRSFKGGSVNFSLNESLTVDLKKLASDEGATMFMLLLSAYYILLNKLSGRIDLVVGTPVAGRQHDDLSQMLGMFVNTLPLRIKVEKSTTFREFLKSVQENTLASYENQAYQYNDLIEALDIDRGSTGNQLFDTMFVFQNYEHSSLEIPRLKLVPFSTEGVVSKFDAVMTATESGDNISVMFDYSADIFKKATIKRFVDFYQTILSDIVSNPDVFLSDISLLNDKEKDLILNNFNDTAAAYPKESSLVSLFESIVAEFPNKNAITSRGLSITYSELNSRANSIAHFLIENGIEPKECVGILANRSIEAVISILGIIKAGGAYLPLDSDYPENRTEHMLREGSVKIVLCNDKDMSLPVGIKVVNINSVVSTGNTANPDIEISSKDIAYVIYTSGSTGTPKGVAVKHQNVVRLVRSCNYAQLDENTRVLQTGAPVFDATTFEIWGALLNGGCLFVEDKEVILNTVKLSRYLSDNKINTLWLTSSLFDEHIKNDDSMFSSLYQLLIGGDTLKPTSVNHIRSKYPSLRVINGYGPTENTTFSVCHVINDTYEHNIPIGKPISNSTAYIVNDEMKLQPIGVIGELLVGGDGVSLGYLNAEELTKQKFLVSPFRPGERVYRTGDLARWLPDGNIEFIGRADDQVKVRGFRVELGEIEASLSSHPKIKHAVVVVKEIEGDKNVISYYVNDEPLDGKELMDHMNKILPKYMVPDYFVHLDQMPLTPNGKVNKKELPDPEVNTRAEVSQATSEVEQKLIRLYSEVLNKQVGSIGKESVFFDLGGNSLKAISLASRIHEVFDFEIMLDEIFDRPQLADLAEHIEAGVMLKDSIGESDSEATNYLF